MCERKMNFYLFFEEKETEEKDSRKKEGSARFREMFIGKKNLVSILCLKGFCRNEKRKKGHRRNLFFSAFENWINYIVIFES